MRFIYSSFISLLLFFIPWYSWAQKDFKSSEWSIIEGNENHQGTQDFSGTIKINSTGDKITVDADIIDDNIVSNDNYLLSDRIEILLSIDDNPSDNLFYVSKDSLTKFHPGYRFTRASQQSNNTSSISFGTVHYYILPSKEKKVFLMDRKNYEWIEKCTGEKPGPIEQGVNIKTDFTKNGYKVGISFSPLALGFVRLPSMNEIKIKLHAIDIDDIKSSTIHSITGDKNEFKNIQFSKSLQTNVTSISTYIYDSLDFHPILMFNSKGFWSGVTKVETKLNSNESNKVAIIRSPIGFRKWKENNVEIEKISFHLFQFQNEGSSEELVGEFKEVYFSKNKKLKSYHPLPNEEWQFKGLQQEFVFQDDFPGLLLIQINTDTLCHGSGIKKLILTKLKGDQIIELLKVTEDPCSSITSIGSLSIQDLKIEKIYWQKDGVALIIEGRIPTKGDMKFRIGFQGDKAIITPIKK